MKTVLAANTRGHADHGWLDSHHTFSFADWYDPGRMGFRSLRVINDDRVAAKAGFPAHSHRNMEIISYVIDGALEHKDSMGNGSIIRRGDVQRMSAGTGVTHSEYNASKTDPVHFLQIWIVPDRPGHAPGYEQKTFAEAERQGKLVCVVSPDGRDGSLRMNQNAQLFSGLLRKGETASYKPADGRHLYLHVVEGSVRCDEYTLHAGDGVAIESPQAAVTLEGLDAAGHVLLFDLA